MNAFSLNDRLALQNLYQAFVGPAPETDGNGLRFVGLRKDSGSGDPYEFVWTPESGLDAIGGFFDFEALNDPGIFPVVVQLGPDSNFQCEPNTPKCPYGCDALGNAYDPSGVTGPRNETDFAWYCAHPPDPDGVDRTGSARCSGQGP